MNEDMEKMYMMYYLGMSMAKGLFEKDGPLCKETHNQVEKILTTKEKEELDTFLTNTVAIKKFLDALKIDIIT